MTRICVFGAGVMGGTELDALLGSVIELAQMTRIATPTLKLVYDLARFRVQMA